MVVVREQDLSEAFEDLDSRMELFALSVLYI